MRTTMWKMIAAMAVAFAFAGAGCGASGSSSARPSPSPSPSLSPFSVKGPFEVVGGRSLAIDCGGSGTVTVVLEVGFDAAGTEGEWRMQALRDRISSRYRVCNYDRANLGKSDPAPKPRTTGDIADDLAALLKNAGVLGPYLMVGVSAGGLYVQHFGARHPDEVVAVLAMNPENPADLFNAEAFPLMTAEEKAGELAYQRGENGQGIDYATSARQMRADGPLTVPLSIMQSNDDCPPDEAICKKLVNVAPKIGRDLVAAAAPGGKFIAVEASHDLYLDIPDQVIAELDRLSARR